MPPTVAAARDYQKERDSRAAGWILRRREQVAGRTSGDAKPADVFKVLQSVDDIAVVAELLQRWALEREDVQIPPKLRKACHEIGEQQRAAVGSRDELDRVSVRVLDLLDKMNGRKQKVYPEKERYVKETWTSAPLVAFMRLLLCSGDDTHALCKRFATLMLPPDEASSQTADRIFVEVGAAVELPGGQQHTDGTTVYVNCYLDGGPKQQTKQVEDNINPIFDEEFVFFLTGDPLLSELRFKVQKKAPTKGLNDEFVGEVAIPVATLINEQSSRQGIPRQYPLGDPKGKLGKSMKKHVDSNGSDDPFGRISLAFRFDSGLSGHRVELVNDADASPQTASKWKFRIIGTGNVTQDQPNAPVGGVEAFECRWEQAKQAHSSMSKLFPWLSQIHFPTSTLADKAMDVAADDTPPKGFVSRARRRSVAMVMGSSAMPTPAQLASMATPSENDTGTSTADTPQQCSSHVRRGQELLTYYTQVFMHQGARSFIFLAQFRKELKVELVEVSSSMSEDLEGQEQDDDVHDEHEAHEEMDDEAELQPMPRQQADSEPIDIETIDASVQRSSQSRAVNRMMPTVDLRQHCPDSSNWGVAENFCLALLRACLPLLPQNLASYCPYVCIAKRGIALHDQPDQADELACDEPREYAIQTQLMKLTHLDKKAKVPFEEALRKSNTEKLCRDSRVQFVQCGETVAIDQIEMPFGPDSTIRIHCTRRNGQSGWATLYGEAKIERIIDGISTESEINLKSLTRRFVAIPDLPVIGHEYLLRCECSNYADPDASRRNDLSKQDGQLRTTLAPGMTIKALAVEETSSSRLLGVVRVQTRPDEDDGQWIDLLHCDTGEAVLTPLPSESVPPMTLQTAGLAVLATTRVVQEEATASEVDAWLAKCSLARYAEAIKAQGYDALSFIRDASEDDIVELATDVGMKKPHKNAFQKAWREIAETDDLASNKQSPHADDPAHSGSEPEPEPEPESDPKPLASTAEKMTVEVGASDDTTTAADTAAAAEKAATDVQSPLTQSPEPEVQLQLTPELAAFFDSESSESDPGQSSDSDDWNAITTAPANDTLPPVPASRPQLSACTSTVTRPPPPVQPRSAEATVGTGTSVVMHSNTPESIDDAVYRLKRDLTPLQDQLVVAVEAASKLIVGRADEHEHGNDGSKVGVERAERLVCGTVQGLAERLTTKLLLMGDETGDTNVNAYVDMVLAKTKRALSSFEDFVSTKCSNDGELMQEIVALEFELDMVGELSDSDDSDDSHDDV